MFLDNHASILSKETYLKDWLLFVSRHSGGVLYRYIKELLEEKYDITEKEEIQKLFIQPKTMMEFYKNATKTEDNVVEDFDVNGVYKYDLDAINKVLDMNDPNFGNPLFSYHSYFEHLEELNRDWLNVSKIDGLTTQFDLKDNEVIIEFRGFRRSLAIYLGEKVNKRFFNNIEQEISVDDMYLIVSKLYTEKDQLLNLEYDPKSGTLLRKCKPGEYRNAFNKCVSNRNIKERLSQPLKKLVLRQPEIIKPHIAKPPIPKQTNTKIVKTKKILKPMKIKNKPKTMQMTNNKTKKIKSTVNTKSKAK
jgi:hypothetical protein